MLNRLERAATKSAQQQCRRRWSEQRKVLMRTKKEEESGVVEKEATSGRQSFFFLSSMNAIESKSGFLCHLSMPCMPFISIMSTQLPRQHRTSLILMRHAMTWHSLSLILFSMHFCSIAISLLHRGKVCKFSFIFAPYGVKLPALSLHHMLSALHDLTTLLSMSSVLTMIFQDIEKYVKLNHWRVLHIQRSIFPPPSLRCCFSHHRNRKNPVVDSAEHWFRLFDMSCNCG